MYTGLNHLHHFLPFLLLLFLLISVISFFLKKQKGAVFSSGDKRISLVTLILAHLQVVVGIVLYAISPVVKAALSNGELMTDATSRFYGLEHPISMIVAVILITIGYSKAKRKEDSADKFGTLSLFYAIGFVLLLIRIPWDQWPFNA